MLIQGKYINGKAWLIKADKSCSNGETLQDYMKQDGQQSHGRKTHT